jgi:uncharacterized membrane protein YqgA involved in biofilm formation
MNSELKHRMKKVVLTILSVPLVVLGIQILITTNFIIGLLIVLIGSLFWIFWSDLVHKNNS